MKRLLKYSVSEQEKESEVLPNKLNLNDLKEIQKAEVEGFFFAERTLLESLREDTIFNFNYIANIHKLALGSLYDFAGKLRTVNISKGGFFFPPAKFLNETITSFEEELI